MHQLLTLFCSQEGFSKKQRRLDIYQNLKKLRRSNLFSRGRTIYSSVKNLKKLVVCSQKK